jgi:hypothetical protein
MNNPRISRKPGQPAGSKKHSDLYTDENPKGTIHGLGFKDVETAKQSVTKIKKSSRSHAHKIQAAIAMEQRARASGKTSEAAVYRKFINSMKEKTKEMNEEGLRDWFGKSKSKDGKPGWVNVVTGGTCASDEPGEGTPKCVSSSKRASMTKAERLSASRRKKIADPGQQEKSGAAKPTYVSTDSPRKKMKEEINVQEAKDKKGKGSGNKDACYHKVKLRYRVWPSAYASGALVKCRKVGADNWGTKSEEKITIEQIILGEELCGKGMYWCNTNKECKPLPKGFNVPGQSVKPTEVGIGKPTAEEKFCNHTKKGTTCPIHGSNVCPTLEEKKDHEYSMARSELKNIEDAVKKLKMSIGKGEGNLEAWVQSKITKAADYIDTAADYVASGEMKEQKLVDKILDELLNEKCWPGYKKKGMKTMFGKRYPNCVKAEDVTIEDVDGNTFTEIVDLIEPEPIKGFKSQIEEATRLQAQTGNIVAITLSWRGKYYSIRMFFPQAKLPSRQEVTDELQKIYPGSKVVNHVISEFTPGQPLIQTGSAGLPSYREQVEFEEDWQKVNKSDKTDGMSQKAVNVYRRENPGSKLKTAVTEKDPGPERSKRRKSFCARSAGQQKMHNIDCSKDPDKAICKARRRWRC